MLYFGKSSKSISYYRNSFSYIYLLWEKAFPVWILSCLNDMIQLPLNHGQFYQVKASWVVKQSPEACMACTVLGCSSVAPFEYLKKKIERLKDTLSVERCHFFSQFFNVKTLNASFKKSGSDKADNKFWNIDITEL